MMFNSSITQVSFFRKGYILLAIFAFLIISFLPDLALAQGAATPLNANDTFGVSAVNDSVG
jgi:hypothetical protein